MSGSRQTTPKRHHELCRDWPVSRVEDCEWCAVHGYSAVPDLTGREENRVHYHKPYENCYPNCPEQLEPGDACWCCGEWVTEKDYDTHIGPCMDLNANINSDYF